MTDPDIDDSDPPGWFWAAIDAARPDVAALETWLTDQPRAIVADFGYWYDTAALELADYWNGIEVDDVVWSEDDMEDLCKWIVGRGRVYWTTVVAGGRPLLDAAREYLADVGRWTADRVRPDHRGYASPGGIAHGVYRSRFGARLHDLIDEPDYEPGAAG